MNRKRTIADLENLYPVDTRYSEIAETGFLLLGKAIREAGVDWRSLPQKVLEKYLALSMEEKKQRDLKYVSREIEESQEPVFEKYISCYFDGACEPKNPGGNMGIGAYILIDEKRVFEESSFVPASRENSNNVAEYKAFLSILTYLIDNQLTNNTIRIFGDSQMVINQMKNAWGEVPGGFAIKGGLYKSYAELAMSKLRTHFEPCLQLRWIPRARNEEADRLSKKALIKNNVKILERC